MIVLGLSATLIASCTLAAMWTLLTIEDRRHMDRPHIF